MSKYLFRAAALSSLLACHGGDASQTAARTGLAGPIVVVSATAPPSVPPGGSGEVTVALAIHADYHIMSDQPSKPEFKATRVAIADAKDVTFGDPAYPAPVTFRYSQDEIRTFVGRIEVRVPVRVAANASPGARTAHGIVHYQACTATECMFPDSAAFDIAINVASN